MMETVIHFHWKRRVLVGGILKDVGRFIKGFGFTEGFLSNVLDKGLLGTFSGSAGVDVISDFRRIMALYGSASD